MSQITIYLDDALEKTVRRQAKAEGVSVSKWISARIEAAGNDSWPASVLSAFGTWNDVSDLSDIPAAYGKDAPRERLD